MRGHKDLTLLAPRRRLGGRSVPLLVAGIIGAAAVLTPAVSGAAAFLTKSKADKRYLGNGTAITSTTILPADTPSTVSVNCPAGQQALSGGADSPYFLGTSMGDGIIITESRPVLSGTRAVGWAVEVLVGTTQTPITVHAVCAP